VEKLSTGVRYRITADKAYMWKENNIAILAGTDKQQTFVSTDYIAIGTVTVKLTDYKTPEDAKNALKALKVLTTPDPGVAVFKDPRGPLKLNYAQLVYYFWQGGLRKPVTIKATIRNRTITQNVSEDRPGPEFDF